MSKKNNKKQFDRNYLKFVFANEPPITFDVDEDRETVTCTIDGLFYSTYPMKDVVARVLEHNNIPVTSYYNDNEEVFGPYQFVSTVKCTEDDVFDETTGKRIAESKCKAKIYTKSLQIISEISEETEKEIQKIKNLGARYLGCYTKEKMHQYKLDIKQNGVSEK